MRRGREKSMGGAGAWRDSLPSGREVLFEEGLLGAGWWQQQGGCPGGPGCGRSAMTEMTPDTAVGKNANSCRLLPPSSLVGADGHQAGLGWGNRKGAPFYHSPLHTHESRPTDDKGADI